MRVKSQNWYRNPWAGKQALTRAKINRLLAQGCSGHGDGRGVLGELFDSTRTEEDKRTDAIEDEFGRTPALAAAKYRREWESYVGGRPLKDLVTSRRMTLIAGELAQWDSPDEEEYSQYIVFVADHAHDNMTLFAAMTQMVVLTDKDSRSFLESAASDPQFPDPSRARRLLSLRKENDGSRRNEMRVRQ